jgi:hypothetical protein
MVENTDPRAVLADNLKRLIEAESRGRDRPLSIRAWAMSKNLDVRMIDRLTKRQHAITLDNLEKIATACGLQPWHLLVPGLDPNSPPDAKFTAEDRATLAKLRSLLSKD